VFAGGEGVRGLVEDGKLRCALDVEAPGVASSSLLVWAGSLLSRELVMMVSAITDYERSKSYTNWLGVSKFEQARGCAMHCNHRLARVSDPPSCHSCATHDPLVYHLRSVTSYNTMSAQTLLNLSSSGAPVISYSILCWYSHSSHCLHLTRTMSPSRSGHYSNSESLAIPIIQTHSMRSTRSTRMSTASTCCGNMKLACRLFRRRIKDGQSLKALPLV
jgi:hypothetical protein